MFRWGKNRKSGKEKPAATPQPAGDDWDFLRAQPDFDADAMQAVHGQEEADALPPLPALPSLLDLPDPEAPRRSPRPVEQPATRGRGVGEHATRPLTVLSELSARFQEPVLPRLDGDGGAWAPESWTLSLELTVCGRRSLRILHRETLLGRADAESGHVPDIDLSADDTVSRRHALIFERGGSFWLRDLDSLNGTRHNGEWLQPNGEVPLRDGDEVALGEFCSFRVVDLMSSAGTPPLLELDRALEETSGPGDTPPQAPQAPADVLDLALQQGEALGLL